MTQGLTVGERAKKITTLNISSVDLNGLCKKEGYIISLSGKLRHWAVMWLAQSYTVSQPQN